MDRRRLPPDKVRGGWPRWSESPLPTLAVLLVVGTLIGRHAAVPEVAWCGAVALALLAALSGDRSGGRLAMGLSACVLGIALGHVRPTGPELDEHAVVQGVVVQSAGTSAVVSTARASWRLSFYPEAAPPVGTRVSARTRPSRPQVRLPGEPDRLAADHRAGRQARRVTRWIRLGGRPEGPAPDLQVPPQGLHADVLHALATGRKAALDSQLRALLQRTGTARLMAISGLHIGLVAGLAHLVIGRLGGLLLRWMPSAGAAPWLRWLCAVGALLAAAAYADTVGWPVSTQRAVVMVAGASFAHAIGRPVRPWSLLAAAAIVVVVAEPSAVDGLGFGLSFGAVLGILGVSPRLLRWLPPDPPWLLGRLAAGVSVTVGAMAGTLPLTAFWFQELSPLSPIANLVAGPLIGTLAVPAALVGVHGPPAVRAPALWVGGHSVELAVQLLNALDVSPWTPAVGPIGALMLAAAVLLRRHLLLAVPLALVAVGAPSLPASDELQVTFLGVGQGDAVFVRHPDGRRWLVDGGPPSERVLRWLRRQGHTRLDAVLLTHPDSDHLGGLIPVFEQLDIGRVVVGRPPLADEQLYRMAWNRLFSRSVPIAVARSGPIEAVPLLHPTPGWRERAGPPALRRPRDNDDSLVLHLEHAGHSILLTGDIEGAAEGWLSPGLPRVDVVQAPHHGSRSSSSAGLVAATDPDWVVVSCGRDNRFGHPHANTLASWRGRRLLRTDRDGTLRVRLGRSGVRVERWVHGWGWVGVRRRPWRPLLPRGGLRVGRRS